MSKRVYRPRGTGNSVPIEVSVITHRPMLRVVPTVGMEVVLDCWPSLRGTVVSVDHHRETAIVRIFCGEGHDNLTFGWRELTREALPY